MNYGLKSFSVTMGSGSKDFADRWEQTFGKKPDLDCVVCKHPRSSHTEPFTCEFVIGSIEGITARCSCDGYTKPT